MKQFKHRSTSGTDPIPQDLQSTPRRTAIGSLFFTLLYVCVPWPKIYENIYGHPFNDRANYLRQINEHNLRSDYTKYDSWLSYITEEFLWSELLKFLTRGLGIDPEVVFFCISSFVIFAFSYLVLSKHHPAALILLLHPLVVGFAFSQLRLALAIAILTCLYLSKVRNKLFLATVIVLCSMIHTTVPLFVIIYWVVLQVNALKGLTSFGAKIVLVLAGFFIALALGPLRDTVFGWTEDRRLDYSEEIQSSATYLSFWIILLVILLVVRDKELNSKSEVRYAIVLLTIVVSSLLFPAYPSRFLAATFPVLINAMVDVSRKLYGLPILLYLVYTIAIWANWLQLV